MGTRSLKLADQIQVIVAEMLERRVKDPRLGFVTITDVRLTHDNRDATVFYTVMGDDAEQASSAAALQSATGLLRSAVGKLGLKFTPTLTFVPDAVPASARHIEELLAAARGDDARRAEQAAGAEYAGDPDPYKRPDEDQPPLVDGPTPDGPNSERVGATDDGRLGA